MLLRSLFATRRIRHGAAAGVAVLASGGLFLLHANAAPTNHPHPYEPTIEPIAEPVVTPFATPPPERASGPTTVDFSGPHVRGTFALSNARVLAGQDQPLFADVTLTAEPNGVEHAPLALVIVLDTSGSMEGEKLAEAKAAVKGLVRDMHDNDEVAFVRYSDDAQLVQPLSLVSEVRRRLIARVDGLTADGGTAIPLGLAAGLRALDGDVGGRVRRVVLVSDGLDSSRPQSERIARVNFDKGITISSMGIGLDFDQAYMGGVARAGHGNFGFVNDGPTLASFLQRELDETATTTAESTVVHLHLPDGVRFVNATGADAVLNGRDVSLKVGALFAQEAKRVMIEMAASTGAGGALDFNESVTWQSVGGGQGHATVPQIEVLCTTDPSAVAAGRNESVLGRAASVAASERQMEAAEAYSNGDARRAASLIQKNVVALREAAVNAPAPMARALAAQESSYQGTMDTFAHAAPQSSMGRIAAKASAASNQANAAAAAF